jgi:hypothetical protein
MEVVDGKRVGKRCAEVDMAPVVEGAEVFLLAESALQRGEEVWERLSVVPDVGAGSMTAAGSGMTAFPCPDIAVGLTKNGGRFQDREVGGDGVQDGRRECGGEKSIPESEGALVERVEIAEDIIGDIGGVFPLRGVVGMPEVGTLSADQADRKGDIRGVPGDDDGKSGLFSGARVPERRREPPLRPFMPR